MFPFFSNKLAGYSIVCYILQVALCREQRRADVLRRREEILEGKRAKRRKVLEARQAAGETIDEKEFEVEIDLNVEDIKIERLPEIHSVVQIHTGKVNSVTCSFV